MRRTILEISKDLLIVLLVCTIILLVLMILPESTVARLPLPEPVLTFLGAEAEDGFVPPQRDTAAAAEPLLISVSGPVGRTTLRRDPWALDRALEQLRPMFSLALSTAAEEKTVTRAALKELMDASGVFLDYGSTMPVAAVSVWLGAEQTSLTGNCRRLLLRCREQHTELVLFGDSIRVYSTDVPSRDLLPLLSVYAPDGSRFLFQKDPGTTLDPLLLWEEQVFVPNAVSENPFNGNRDFADTVATALAFNPYGSSTYTDGDGNRVYTEQNRSCTVTPDGAVSLSAAADILPADPDPASRIDAAFRLLQTISGTALGEARLCFRTYAPTGDGAICTFGYVLNGIPVWPDCAEVVFRGESLTELHFRVRQCRTGTSTITCLPMLQATALASAESSPAMGYFDNGSGTLSLQWRAP